MVIALGQEKSFFKIFWLKTVVKLLSDNLEYSQLCLEAEESTGKYNYQCLCNLWWLSAKTLHFQQEKFNSLSIYSMYTYAFFLLIKELKCKQAHVCMCFYIFLCSYLSSLSLSHTDICMRERYIHISFCLIESV